MNILPALPYCEPVPALISPSSCFHGLLQLPLPAISMVARPIMMLTPTAVHGPSSASPAILPPLPTILRNSNLADPMPAFPTLQPGAMRLTLALNAVYGDSRLFAQHPS